MVRTSAREIHRIICPLRTTSGELSDYESHNLWIIDERLSYHSYLTSDKPLSSMEVLDSRSPLRPDIAIFNRSAYAEGDSRPYPSVVIVEFKRPVREDYAGDQRPLDQVFSYIRKMREGAAQDDTGRPIPVVKNTSFYVYIIADLTPALVKQADDGDFMRAPDGMGYFLYHRSHRAYIEIISYDKLLADAKKRNRILFEKLNVPPSAGR